MGNRISRIFGAASLVLMASLVASGGIAVGAGDGAHDASQRRQLAEAHRATARYQRVDVALADGYVPVSECTELPGVGAMGIHYLHPARAADPALNPSQPEILLYSEEGGRLRLVGAEWFLPDADGDLSTDGDRPSLFGQAFDGPMPGHDEHMPVHYDLHVWLWKHNPAGQLAAWNPALSCP